MARKADLRLQRAGTVINLTSKQQETALGKALKKVVASLQIEFADVQLHHKQSWRLVEIVDQLKRDFPDVPFAEPPEPRWLEPDGGILSIVDRRDKHHVILISEVKNQGTNDKRKAEGKKRQAQGNAIERLGKNVIGFRTAMLTEAIMPFVCFGYGCDFATNSSILDRVVTMAMFGPLNEIELHNRGDGGQFNRGSFFFQEKQWTQARMADVMHEVASRSIHYYFSKHGKAAFRQ
ncbi:MAG TPA: EcoRI family type II restriction endonuclease [Solirubrobacteraceae bacterium]